MTAANVSRRFRAFVALSIAGLLLVATELAFRLFGRQLCPTDGCSLVAQYARFGDESILLFGALLFGALALLGLRCGRGSACNGIVNIAIVAALAAEGFLTGYQAFRLFTPCLFCLAVFCVVAALGALRVAEGHRDVLAGFAACAAVFALFFFILPAGVSAGLPRERMLLFYGDGCTHCELVTAEIERRRLPVARVRAADHPGFLLSLGIGYVPALMVSGEKEKRFIWGADGILRFLDEAYPHPAKRMRTAPSLPRRQQSKTSASDTVTGGRTEASPAELLSPGQVRPSLVDDGCVDATPCK